MKLIKFTVVLLLFSILFCYKKYKYEDVELIHKTPEKSKEPTLQPVKQNQVQNDEKIINKVTNSIKTSLEKTGNIQSSEYKTVYARKPIILNSKADTEVKVEKINHFSSSSTENTQNMRAAQIIPQAENVGADNGVFFS